MNGKSIQGLGRIEIKFYNRVGKEPKPEFNIQQVPKRRRRGKFEGQRCGFRNSEGVKQWKGKDRSRNGIQRGAGMARVRGIFITGEQLLTCKFILAAIRAKLRAEQLEQFKTSCFGHLLNIDKIQFSGRLCIGASFGEVPEVSSGESDEIRLQKRYFIDEGITCNALEEAFLRCTEEDDIYKLALVYFAELVILGRDKYLNINLNYLTLVEDLDAFNRYPWGSVSFDKTQDSLFSAPTKYVKSFENEERRGKGKSKVTGTSRRNEKGKKDKHGEVQRGGLSFKGFTYAFQIWVYEFIPKMADLNYCKVVDPTVVPFSSIAEAMSE
ncbi:hypothetical protein Prudu_001915 [Prunus dulcis]|uniref:DUF1985 domain-containing protein n=1 Tax=Prunus dulcis TaxID=3755 RepID=A0A4Y1QPN2_PRUDU|nr:hypothetical protein Prudu_001915 [Prunus dulcis]